MNLANITLIGAGNMGAALLGGLIKRGFSANNIFITDPDEQKLDFLKQKYNVNIEQNNSTAISSAEVILFAIKPQHFSAIAKPLAPIIQKNQPLIISIAAGVLIKNIDHWLDKNIAIVRCMPNTPALIGAGISALFANSVVTLQQRNIAESIMSAVGETIWLEDEKLLDAVTALSGSGPAYFFLVIEALQAAGQKLGLSAEISRKLTLQTALGAAKMASSQDVPVDELRRRVTSPGGTTEAALRVLEHGRLADLFCEALLAAKQRATELASLADSGA